MQREQGAVRRGERIGGSFIGEPFLFLVSIVLVHLWPVKVKIEILRGSAKSR